MLNPNLSAAEFDRLMGDGRDLPDDGCTACGAEDALRVLDTDFGPEELCAQCWAEAHAAEPEAHADVFHLPVPRIAA